MCFDQKLRTLRPEYVILKMWRCVQLILRTQLSFECRQLYLVSEEALGYYVSLPQKCFDFCSDFRFCHMRWKLKSSFVCVPLFYSDISSTGIGALLENYTTKNQNKRWQIVHELVICVWQNVLWMAFFLWQQQWVVVSNQNIILPIIELCFQNDGGMLESLG